MTSTEASTLLGDGDRPPRIVTSPPGPRSCDLARLLDRHEAPGINTLVDGRTLVWEAARGANVVDVDGNRYVDLTAGFGAAAVGHAHPEVVAAVAGQASRLMHGLGDVHAHPIRVELARRLAAWLPLDEPQIYFAVSGSDAVDVALKTALLATGRSEVVAFDPAYHGLGLGSLRVTAREHFRLPFAAILRPGVHRLSYGCDPGRLDASLAGGRIGAVVVEPIVGREGVILPPTGWLADVAAAAQRHGTLLIADEVLTGFGRTGHRFAVEHEGVRPDIIVCGKALGGGMPIGVAAARREIMAAWKADGEARHTSTFVAHPPACAGALVVLDLLEREGLDARARELGNEIGARLESWPRRLSDCHATRGRGLLWGIELGRPDAASRCARQMLEQGYLVLAGGAEGRVLELSPPLTIARHQLDAALDCLEGVLAG